MLAGLLVTFGVSALICGVIAYFRPVVALDQPLARSMHTRPVPRLGGVGLLCGMAAGLLVANGIRDPLVSIAPISALLVLWLLALLDDFFSLAALLRLVVQAAVALVFVLLAGVYWHGPGLLLLWQGIAVLLLVWGTNLYNFMDGIDGIAAGQAITGFGVMAVLGWGQGHPEYAYLCALPAVAAAGFLGLNCPPARLFLGDSGSTVLGLLMVVLSYEGVSRAIFPVWVPLLLFAPFWMDASATLAKRIWRRERWWEAHRQHHYQRWVMAGYSHRQVATGYATLSLLGGIVAWQAKGLAGMAPVWVPCSLVLVVYGALVVASEHILKRKERQ